MTRVDPQLSLFDQPMIQPAIARGATIADRFEAFDEANPWVYRVIVDLARDLRHNRRFRRCGMKLIFERMRWLSALRTKGDAFKLNNNYTAHYARLVMENEPDLANFFETRERKIV